jgi:hypothetical protein
VQIEELQQAPPLTENSHELHSGVNVIGDPSPA